jgi:NitT/TauT family transport system permease protein
MTERRSKCNSIPALLFWIGLWWIGAEAFGNPLLLPGPWQVLKCLGTLASTASFWQTVALSIGRILLGAVTAVMLGVALAALTTASPLAEVLIAPAMTAMQATPVASFTILVLIWLDRDWVPVLICGMMVLPVVWNSISTGIRTVDVQLLEMAKVYRLRPLRILKRIYLPSLLPFFRTACSSALGLGWKAGIAAEVLTVPKISIGKMIAESKSYLLTEELFAWTLTVIVLSLVLQNIMLRLLKGRGNDA